MKVQRWTEHVPTTVLWCPVCRRSSPDLSKSDAGVLLEISSLTFDRLLAEGKLHYLQSATVGSERVCLASILAYRGSVGGQQNEAD
jgi:hypothetical protein